MSWQAVQAVLQNSQQDHPTARLILVAIAEHADESGIAKPGPGQERIADYVHCSSRTVRNWLPALVESGELQIIQAGNGKGYSTTYRICLEIPKGVPAAEKQDDSKGGNKVEELSALVEKLTLKVEEIAERLSTLEAKGGNKVETKVEIAVSAEPIEPEEPKSKTPLNPPAGQGERPARANKAATVLTIPERLNTPEFLEEWGKWQAYRGKIKANTYQGQLDKLSKEPPEFAAARLERSRTNGWTGLWFSDEKPIVINGRTADGRVYQNGRGPGSYYQPPQRPVGIPEIVLTEKGY